jgi:pimeloyl-ACP methyl ester carboxylesterase
MSDGPSWREAGQGEPVICLHCSASSGGQWRTLLDRLAPRWRVLAPDLYGYGQEVSRDGFGEVSLDDELGWLDPVLERAGERVHLVGHSYGGLIALHLALRYARRVNSVSLYEPAAWSIAWQDDPTHPGSVEIEELRDATIAACAAGDLDAIAERFVRYWAGDRAWEAMPTERRRITAQAMPKVAAEFAAERRAARSDTRLLDLFARIDAPVLYLTGTRTKASARRVGQLLPAVWKNARVIELDGPGHMGPVTHPDLVNREIEAFLEANRGPAK